MERIGMAEAASGRGWFGWHEAARRGVGRLASGWGDGKGLTATVPLTKGWKSARENDRVGTQAATAA